MPFKVCEVDSKAIENMADLKNYAKREMDSVVYLPLEKFLSKHSLFMDDEFYGRGTDWVKFNVDGFNAFCNTFNIPYWFLDRIIEPGLVSNILNDYIENDFIKEQMANYQLVVDSKEKTVLGVVSKTYRKYYNQTLLDDLEKYFPKLNNDYELAESYVINTNLYFRVLSSKIKAGFVTGSGGSGEDISRVGLQISNSLVGDSSVKICFFILRLKCANGLTVESFNSKGRVIHSGRQDTFPDRFKNAISPLLKEIKTIPKLIEALNTIPFNPEILVKYGGAECIYDIIPLDKNQVVKRKRLKGKELIAFDTDVVAQYPYIYGGEFSKRVFHSPYRSNQSLFDLVNVFTEYAHSREVETYGRRIEIEKKTGELVKWILANKKKLANNGGNHEQIIF